MVKIFICIYVECLLLFVIVSHPILKLSQLFRINILQFAILWVIEVKDRFDNVDI